MTQFLQPLPQQCFHCLRLNFFLSSTTLVSLRVHVVVHRYRRDDERKRRVMSGLTDCIGRSTWYRWLWLRRHLRLEGQSRHAHRREHPAQPGAAADEFLSARR
jgi:hypothetical protein